MNYRLRHPVNAHEHMMQEAALRALCNVPHLEYVRFTLPPESQATWVFAGVPSNKAQPIYTIKRDPIGHTEDYSILEVNDGKNVVMLLAAECGLIAEKVA